MNDNEQQDAAIPAERLEQGVEIVRRIAAEIGRAVIGQRDVIEHLLACALAGGHLLVEGVPGLGKTLLVRAFAKTFAGDFSRIQFTPDLMPADVTGHAVFDIKQQSFSVRKGRCSPTCCWPTRSTARRPRPSRRCSKRCRSARSPSRARRTDWGRRSWCWRRKIRWSRKAPTRCPRRSSTASSSSCASATRARAKNRPCCAR